MMIRQVVADAIREVTSKVQQAIEGGSRSRQVDADDLVEVFLAIADRLDPPLVKPAASASACPACGETDPDRLVWQDDHETVRCAACQTAYLPAGESVSKPGQLVLDAARALLEARENQMVTAVEWENLKTAVGRETTTPPAEATGDHPHTIDIVEGHMAVIDDEGNVLDSVALTTYREAKQQIQRWTDKFTLNVADGYRRLEAYFSK